MRNQSIETDLERPCVIELGHKDITSYNCIPHAQERYSTLNRDTTDTLDENYNVWDEKHTWMVLTADEEMQKKRLRNLKKQQ